MDRASVRDCACVRELRRVPARSSVCSNDRRPHAASQRVLSVRPSTPENFAEKVRKRSLHRATLCRRSRTEIRRAPFQETEKDFLKRSSASPLSSQLDTSIEKEEDKKKIPISSCGATSKVQNAVIIAENALLTAAASVAASLRKCAHSYVTSVASRSRGRKRT